MNNRSLWFAILFITQIYPTKFHKFQPDEVAVAPSYLGVISAPNILYTNNDRAAYAQAMGNIPTQHIRNWQLAMNLPNGACITTVQELQNPQCPYYRAMMFTSAHPNMHLKGSDLILVGTVLDSKRKEKIMCYPLTRVLYQGYEFNFLTQDINYYQKYTSSNGQSQGYSRADRESILDDLINFFTRMLHAPGDFSNQNAHEPIHMHIKNSIVRIAINPRLTHVDNPKHPCYTYQLDDQPFICPTTPQDENLLFVRPH